MASPQIDETQLQALAAEGLSPTEIAKRLNLPRSTVRDCLKRLDLASLPSPTEDMTPHSPALVRPDMDIDMMTDLQELIAWWHARKVSLHQTSDPSRETERTTFHVEKRWVEAIRRQADLDHLTITQIVNEAFRQYFTGK